MQDKKIILDLSMKGLEGGGAKGLLQDGSIHNSEAL